MSKQQNIANPGGVNGTGKGIVNINSEDYKALQKAVSAHAQNQSPEEKIEIGLMSLKIQMESYMAEKNPSRITEAGEFLKKHLEVIGVKHKTFAQYMDIEESNLSAIIHGRRKMNIDLAFKLGQIFQIHPNIWLHVQSKNEWLQLDEAKREEYKKYKLDDLLKKAG